MSSPSRPMDAVLADLLGPLNAAAERMAADRIAQMRAAGELVDAELVASIETERDDVINIVEGLGQSIEQLLTGMRSYVRRATFTYPGAADWQPTADQLATVFAGLDLNEAQQTALHDRITHLVRDAMAQEAVRTPQSPA